MKISILQQDLLPALQSVARSCGVRASLAVLANILIQAQDNILKLSATNLEVGVIKVVKASIQESGEITVPAKTLLEIVSSLGTSELELVTEGDQLLITSLHFNAKLNGIPANEFPAIPLASEKSISVSAKVLALSLPQIAFAAASEDGRPILTGVLTEIHKDALELVATDGFRLAHKTADLSKQAHSPAREEFRSLIPRRTFEEVVRLIAEEAGGEENALVEVSTSDNQNQIIFKIGQTQLSSRLIEGQFPAWEKIIPKTEAATATLSRTDFLKAVKIASVFARGETANIIKINLAAGKFSISSEARELGGQETQLESVTEGEDLVIAFNSRFLTESLSACSSSQVKVQFSGSLSPTLIKPLDEPGLEYVIMPVRMN